MITFHRVITSFSLVFFVLALMLPISALAGYNLTDRDGKVISEAPTNALVTGPTNQIIILNDRGNHKVFEITWDAETRAVMVKGDKIQLKIHSNGNIEKWTGLDNKEQTPLYINPVVVPVVPPRK